MASYSVPDSRGVMYPMGGNGRWFISFNNPNGTVTGMWQNTNATYDSNWVAPPDSAWSSWGVYPDYLSKPASVQGNITSVAPTIFTSGQDTGYHGPSGPVVPFEQYMEVKTEQVAQRLADLVKNNPTSTSTNTTNATAASNVTGSVSSDPIWGHTGSNPTILGFNEYAVIGVVGVAVLAYMFMGKGR